MNYIYIGTANNVDELIVILIEKVPVMAFVEMSVNHSSSPSVEVWYDKDTNTVILK